MLAEPIGFVVFWVAELFLARPPTGVADGGWRGAGVGGTSNGAGLWPTAVPASQDNTSDTETGRCCRASNPRALPVKSF